MHITQIVIRYDKYKANNQLYIVGAIVYRLKSSPAKLRGKKEQE